MRIPYVLATVALLACFISTTAHAATGYYLYEYNECNYITQSSMSEARGITIAHSAPGYGALNDWRIGNGKADNMEPGTAAVGIIGLLYGINRLDGASQSTSTLDSNADTTLSSFFWSWIRNSSNQVTVGGKIAFCDTEAYDTSGNVTSIGTADVAATAELLIAMNKYRQLSPNADRASWQSQEYSLAHSMADYVNANLDSWTIDRSYAVAAFRGFANWATAYGDTSTATYYTNQANTVSGWLANAQDTSSWHNYFDYLNGGGTGVYNNSNVDQTGFSPYEFDARNPGESFAAPVAQWWDYGTAYSGDYLTVQGGRYAGGVCQAVPSLYGNAYPGDSFQLADAEWKIAHADGNLHNQYAQAWWHYNAAITAYNSGTGLACRVTDTSIDGVVGGFVDWVGSSGNYPATWQRFVDTSAYCIVATEELEFSNMVDWSQ